jgi:hypothetical protein
MKLLHTTAIWASILSSAGLVVGAPRVKPKHGTIAVSGLGGSTFRVHQEANPHFRNLGNGPRARAKAYQKFGVPVPESLLDVLLEILEQLGIHVPGLEGGSGDGNGTTTGGRGEVTLICTVTIVY